MIPIIRASGAVASSGGLFPSLSHDFEKNNSEYLSMSNTNFGDSGRSRTLASLSLWFKLESNGFNQDLIQYGDWLVRINSSNKILWNTTNATTAGLQITTATYSTGTWYHLYQELDMSASAGDRMKMWVNGTEITTFDTDTNPVGDLQGAAGNVSIGANSGSLPYDGKLWQVGYFDGVKAGISNVYNSGPAQIQGISGLHSLPNPGLSVINDFVLTPNWTDNNTVGTSTDIPS